MKAHNEQKDRKSHQINKNYKKETNGNDKTKIHST